MNKILTRAGIALVVATLAACSPGLNVGAGYHISFDRNGLVVHAPGQPNAHVSRNGDLTIGDKSVAVTAAQRQLLQRYYRQATSTMDSGVAIGKQGVEVATRGIGDAIASIFHGDSAAADKQLDAQSQNIEAAAGKLCADVKALGATQAAIAASLPAFKPYASSNKLYCEVTHKTTYRVDGKTTSTSTTYALHTGSSAAPAHASPRKADSTRQPDAAQGSQP